MDKSYPSIEENLAAFLRPQHVFFVATAPRSSEGHVNLSPKGLSSFVILDPLTRMSDFRRHAVRLYDCAGERDQLQRWAERKGPAALHGYREQNNTRSIDGLPGLRKR